MRPNRQFTALAAAMAILASSSLAGTPANVGASELAATTDTYALLDRDLANLRERFNADRGKVRAVFLASPTCGICLHGVAELQKKMLETIGAEDLAVYVVWSSQLGAEERHVQPGMRLIPDDRAAHYWDPDQLLGIAYQPTFDIPSPIWDYWLLFERDAAWPAGDVPEPAWWEYQGRPMDRPEELVLDPERFAQKTRDLLTR